MTEGQGVGRIFGGKFYVKEPSSVFSGTEMSR